MKQTINEAQLKQIVSNVVKRILSEEVAGTYDAQLRDLVSKAAITIITYYGLKSAREAVSEFTYDFTLDAKQNNISSQTVKDKIQEKINYKLDLLEKFGNLRNEIEVSKKNVLALTKNLYSVGKPIYTGSITQTNNHIIRNFFREAFGLNPLKPETTTKDYYNANVKNNLTFGKSTEYEYPWPLDTLNNFLSPGVKPINNDRTLANKVAECLKTYEKEDPKTLNAIAQQCCGMNYDAIANTIGQVAHNASLANPLQRKRMEKNSPIYPKTSITMPNATLAPRK